MFVVQLSDKIPGLCLSYHNTVYKFGTAGLAKQYMEECMPFRKNYLVLQI